MKKIHFNPVNPVKFSFDVHSDFTRLVFNVEIDYSSLPLNKAISFWKDSEQKFLDDVHENLAVLFTKHAGYSGFVFKEEGGSK